MPEEITGTSARRAVPVEVVAAAAQSESQLELPNSKSSASLWRRAFAPPSANDDARTMTGLVHEAPRCPVRLAQWRGIRPHPRHERLPHGSPEQRWSRPGLATALTGWRVQLGVVRKAWAKKSTGLARSSSANATR